jgi:uncharacterized protein (DUF2062 family)
VLEKYAVQIYWIVRNEAKNSAQSNDHESNVIDSLTRPINHPHLQPCRVGSIPSKCCKYVIVYVFQRQNSNISNLESEFGLISKVLSFYSKNYSSSVVQPQLAEGRVR